MKKLVRTNLTNSPTRRGTENLNIQFYSHDKNNAGFEFVVKNETDLSQYTAKVLFKFRDSNSTWEANGTIEGNVIKVTFNTNLIARCEEVLGYLFLDSDSDSLDVFKFKFNVVLSEIDKSEVANRQIKHVNNIGELELVTRSQLKEELSKLQINSVDLTNYLTTTVADDRYAQKQELTSYALSKDVPSINGLVTEEQLTEAKNSVVEEVKKLGYAKTTEVPVEYNDSALSERVTNLENKVDKDTIYDDKPLSDRVRALENAPKVNTTEFNLFKESAASNVISVRDRLGKLEKSILSNNNSLSSQTLSLNNGTLSISGGNSVVLPVNRYEIHGTGMPNGVVEAEIGTTYIDKNKTNGAFKWIKTTDGGNQGWEVIVGDTGWRTLNSVSKVTIDGRTSTIKIRRVNNLVTYQFGGLENEQFGIVGRSSPEFMRGANNKTVVVVPINGIPEGFRSELSRVGDIFYSYEIPYGTWYLGGKNDSNYIRLVFFSPIQKDYETNYLKVSTISYLTDDEWPVQLP